MVVSVEPTVRRCHGATIKSQLTLSAHMPTVGSHSRSITGYRVHFTMAAFSDLERYLVPGTTSTYYIPNFVTEEEEEYLIRSVRF